MRKITLLISALLILCVTVSAHSGKTDANGGHYDHSTGEYHFHHGFPAHQHTGGVCPYDFVDQTDTGTSNSLKEDTGGSIQVEGAASESERDEGVGKVLLHWVLALVFVVFPVTRMLRFAMIILPEEWRNGEKDGPSAKNKKIVAWSTVIFNVVFIPFFNRAMGGLWCFDWVNGANLVRSIPGILGMWFVFGMIPVSISCLFSLLVCAVLHKNQMRWMNGGRPNKSDQYFSAIFSLVVSYTVLLLFIVRNLIFG